MTERGQSAGTPSAGGDDDDTEMLEVDPGAEGGHQSEDTEPETSDKNSGVTSTRSLVGSILHYPVENGRRYSDSGPDAYFMPNDEIEQTRLNVMHSMYLYLLDGQLSLAPVPPEPKKILDVGTGTGEWAIGMAETYPFADVTGIDLSAIQPSAVPSNVFFEVDDIEQEWSFGAVFDFIHLRNLSGSFKSWSNIYKECYRHLQPGAYLEVIDFDHMYAPKSSSDSYVYIMIAAMREAAEKSGREWGIGHLKRNVLEAAGFREVTTKIFTVPVGTWPGDATQKTIGKLWLICLLEGLEAVSLRLLTRELGWEAEQVRDLCRKVTLELKDGNLQASSPVHYVTARKPLNPSQ
ncbi:MAG: hypothetical protein M1833_000119 [Piccolia ochrophora]|nr:MAG: hypothetical protein M1833_000119 [Piccolia ochrophora]